MRLRAVDDPWLTLAYDPAGEDVVSGWSTDRDADTVAEPAAGEFGASLRRLNAPCTNPLAVPARPSSLRGPAPAGTVP
ncbi:hypothetical protein ACIGQE_20280 [Streptomyces sp. NPDC053429]|uniref:hypothetical protein n=1 Tax=Streptomyces sp. NPDC053429 TaxID=3365702 RepID=UPI0037D86576